MTIDKTDFENALNETFRISEELGLFAIEVNSGNLHRRVGEYPGHDHRMPVCCDVLYGAMKSTDSIISQPDLGKGASVVIRYILPRSN